MSQFDWCNDCADTHSRERRRAILEPLGNVQPQEVYRELGELAGHLWGRRTDGKRGGTTRKLERDLAILRERNGWEISKAPAYTPADAARIMRLRALGLGPTAIAKRLGNRSKNGIRNFLVRRLGT